MNSAQLLRAIGDIDPVYVDVTPIEELIRKKKPIAWIKWCSVAACLALMAGCGWRIVFPKDNTPVLDDSPRYYASHSFGFDSPYTYCTLAEASELIVVADVESLAEENVPLYMSNIVSVKVREVLKGDVHNGDVLLVEDLTSSEYMHDPDIPMMQYGNRMLLFLVKETIVEYTLSDETKTVYGFTQTYPHLGRFFLDEDGKYHEADTYSENFPYPHSWRVFADYMPRTLDEIKDLIGIE